MSSLQEQRVSSVSVEEPTETLEASPEVLAQDISRVSIREGDDAKASSSQGAPRAEDDFKALDNSPPNDLSAEEAKAGGPRDFMAPYHTA